MEGYGWNIGNPESFYNDTAKEWGVDFVEGVGFRIWVSI
jgi:hypothetical protein